MKRKKRVAKGSRRGISLQAAAEEPTKPASMEEILRMYRARKKRVTLWLDADVLAWFRKPGRRYQTRINRALRKVMEEGRKKEE